MIGRTPFVRAATSIVIASALLAGTAGCTFITPQATLTHYTPGNGVAGKVGSVDVLNTVAITADGGKTVNLVVTLVNSGQTTAAIELQYKSNGAKQTVIKRVAAGDATSFGNKGESQIVVQEPGVEPGSLLPVYVQYGDNVGTQLMVPVLAADGMYKGLGAESVKN